MIPLAVPSLSGNEGRYLQECIETTYVSSVGPFVDRFEQAVAAAAGTDAAVATSAGTTGLHVALTALGVRSGDLVILPSFTFIASANAIAHCGAEPWLFDIFAESWTIDPGLLRKRLRTETRRESDQLVHIPTGRRVAAILPVYTLGTPADMDPIVELAGEYGLPVVADAAAALGATYRGRPVGGLGATLSVFSFNGNKTVTTGGGGAVIGDDPKLLDLVRHLSTTARVGDDYHHDRVGFNYRMTNLQAAVGCAQMERMDELIAAKRRIRDTYGEAFAGLAGVEPFPDPNWTESACWFSGIVLDADRAKALRAIRTRLRDNGIEARSFWKPIHLQAPFVGAPRTSQPICEELWGRLLTLPCSTNLTDEQRSMVISSVLKVLN